MKKIFLAVLGLSLTLVGCSSKEAVSDMEPLVVYKKAVNNQWDLPLDKDIQLTKHIENDKEKIDALFEIMKQPSKDDRTVPIIPDNVKLLKASIENQTMTVNLSKEFDQINDSVTKELVLESIRRTMILNFTSEVANVTIHTDGVSK